MSKKRRNAQPSASSTTINNESTETAMSNETTELNDGAADAAEDSTPVAQSDSVHLDAGDSAEQQPAAAAETSDEVPQGEEPASTPVDTGVIDNSLQAPAAVVVQATMTAEPAPAPTAAPVAESKPAAAASPVQAIIDKAVAASSTSGQVLIYQIQQYMENMGPHRTVSEQEGARYQVVLYRALVSIINNLDADFQPVFSAVLKLFVHGAEGVFHETNVFRFMDTVALPESDRKTFLRLLNFIKLMADPRSRTVATKQVNIQASFGQSITEVGKRRVMDYFGL